MSQKVEDLTLIKFLGKGAFGEVYLSQKTNSNKYFATKKIDRKIADRPKLQKYLVNEINILKTLNHPNIVRLEEVKKNDEFYYIVMEYINGGGLSECLKKYMDKYGKAFSEEIVQHLMRQILDALAYIHDKKIIHRDLKLDNIMVNFDSQADKDNLNMMKAKIKIIDFGFSVLLTEQNLAKTTVGSPINMDPIILEKFNKLRDKNITYDTKADIWSLGTVCYELLIGKAVFNAETMEDLVNKVKDGKYKVPSTISKELIDFLNQMLQYDANYRSTARELQNHPFIRKNVKNFTHMKAKQRTKNYNIKQNKSFWAIYDEEDKFINMKEKNYQIPIKEEEKIKNNYQNQPHQHHRNLSPKQNRHYINEKELPNKNEIKYHKIHSDNYNEQHQIKKDYRRNKTTAEKYPYSFYGQTMNLNSPVPQMLNYGTPMPFAYNTPQYAYPQTPYGTTPYPYVGYNLQNPYQNVPNIGINYPYVAGKGNNNQVKRAQTNYPFFRIYK